MRIKEAVNIVNEMDLPTDSPRNDRDIPTTKANMTKRRIFFLMKFFFTNIFYLFNSPDDNMPIHSLALTLGCNIFELDKCKMNNSSI